MPHCLNLHTFPYYKNVLSKCHYKLKSNAWVREQRQYSCRQLASQGPASCISEMGLYPLHRVAASIPGYNGCVMQQNAPITAQIQELLVTIT